MTCNSRLYFLQRKKSEKPPIHRSGTLRSFHPAFRFHSRDQYAGHVFEGSFAATETDTDSISSTDGASSRENLQYWPGAVR